MKLSSILKPEGVLPALSATCERQAFLKIAGSAANMTGVPQREIFDELMERERLGNTGVGGGVAIPHCRLPGIAHVTALFARLAKPVDFSAKDGKPVDLLFVLLAPDEESGEHLKALARIARLLADPVLLEEIREAADMKTIYTALTREH